MAGSHLSGGSSYSGRSRSRRRRGGAGKVIVLIIALIIIIAVAGYFVATNVFGMDLLGYLPFTSTTSDTVVNGTMVSIQDASGKNVTKNVTVTEGTTGPEELENPIVLSTTWNSMFAAKYPVIISVTNSAFTDDDGLTIYQYNGTSWNELGTFLIKNNTVSFQVYTLSQFAVSVVSSEPEATPTPEPTASAEPTPTPEPEPEVDYGTYNTEVEGLFVDTDSITKDGQYIIAVLHDEDEDDLYATVVLHYGEEELGTVDVALEKTESGRYYISDPVVDGMLWTAGNNDEVVGLTRYALSNNDMYLNLNSDCDEFILDEDPDGRTRWVYENIASDGTESLVSDENEAAEDSVNTLSYYNEEVLYFLKSSKNFTATSDINEGQQVILFCLNGTNTDSDLSDEETEEAAAAIASSGTTSLTAEPTNVNQVNATSRPVSTTPTPVPGGAITPVTAAPSTTDSPAAVDPTAQPSGDDTGGDSGSTTGGDTGGSTGGDTGGGSGGGSAASGSNADVVPASPR